MALKRVTQYCGIEAGALSLIDMTVHFGGGLERGHYMALKGDVRVDEDLAGAVGTLVATCDWTEETRGIVWEGGLALRTDDAHRGVRENLLVMEKGAYRSGWPPLPPQLLRTAAVESRGNVGGSVAGHAIPCREAVRRAQMRSTNRRALRAGVMYGRVSGIGRDVTWTEDVEALLFPYLYLNGTGGYECTSRLGVVWEEHVEKRLWSINPAFRNSSLFVAFMFDFGEKLEMHSSSTATFLPDTVLEEDAHAYSYLSEANARSYENQCRKDLMRGRWALAAVSDAVTNPNVFQTETMNERDMSELQLCSFDMVGEGEWVVDDVTVAYLYKVRQIVLMEDVLPCTGLKGLVYGSIRLEIQSGRSYRLHAQNMLRVEADEATLFGCVSAALSSLSPVARAKHEPVARHRCLSYKCRNDICTYGYPVLEAAQHTHRVRGDGDDAAEGRIVYRRELGMPGVMEQDEFVTPFCVELSSCRVCHGAFLICTDELAIGYTGKYVFKRSGGMAGETGHVLLADVIEREPVQLLKEDGDLGRKQHMKERIGIRMVSMMEMSLHLCGESIVYSTFHLRELWVVLPDERKKFYSDGVLRRGIAGGKDLQLYYRRPLCCENDTFEAYFGRDDVVDGSDASRHVRVRAGGPRVSQSQSEVLVGGVPKRLIARIMPISGRGKHLIDKCCWALMLRRIPHRTLGEVWRRGDGEESWDAAARSGAVGECNRDKNGLEALHLAMDACVDIEVKFLVRMGKTTAELDISRRYFEEAVEGVVTELTPVPQPSRNAAVDPLDYVADARAGDSGREIRVRAPLSVAEATEKPWYVEEGPVRAWRDRFRAQGWGIRENAPEEPNLEDVRVVHMDMALTALPPAVEEVLLSLQPYPSQLAACLEIMDTIVRKPVGLRRFLSGAAGRGKSHVKKSLTRILRSAGFHVKVIAVAALVAQDDEQGGGATIASAFNMFGVGAQAFDDAAYDLSHIDLFIVDECSMVSVEQGRNIAQYLARGSYLRGGGIDLALEARESRHVSRGGATRHRASDPWFGANLVLIGDLMQLDAPGGDPLYGSERMWGAVFRSRTLLLREPVRSTDPTS